MKWVSGGGVAAHRLRPPPIGLLYQRAGRGVQFGMPLDVIPRTVWRHGQQRRTGRQNAQRADHEFPRALRISGRLGPHGGDEISVQQVALPFQ